MFIETHVETQTGREAVDCWYKEGGRQAQGHFDDQPTSVNSGTIKL